MVQVLASAQVRDAPASCVGEVWADAGGLLQRMWELPLRALGTGQRPQQDDSSMLCALYWCVCVLAHSVGDQWVSDSEEEERGAAACFEGERVQSGDGVCDLSSGPSPSFQSSQVSMRTLSLSVNTTVPLCSIPVMTSAR